MAEEPKPQPDVVEQTRSLREDEEDLSSIHDDPEVPEADALDQHRTTGSTGDGGRVSDDPEVPEADAAEQGRAIADDEDEMRSE